MFSFLSSHYEQLFWTFCGTRKTLKTDLNFTKLCGTKNCSIYFHINFFQLRSLAMPGKAFASFLSRAELKGLTAIFHLILKKNRNFTWIHPKCNSLNHQVKIELKLGGYIKKGVFCKSSCFLMNLEFYKLPLFFLFSIPLLWTINMKYLVRVRNFHRLIL